MAKYLWLHFWKKKHNFLMITYFWFHFLISNKISSLDCTEFNFIFLIKERNLSNKWNIIVSTFIWRQQIIKFGIKTKTKINSMTLKYGNVFLMFLLFKIVIIKGQYDKCKILIYKDYLLWNPTVSLSGDLYIKRITVN